MSKRRNMNRGWAAGILRRQFKITLGASAGQSRDLSKVFRTCVGDLGDKETEERLLASSLATNHSQGFVEQDMVKPWGAVR
jgi:hypothetical protein